MLIKSYLLQSVDTIIHTMILTTVAEIDILNNLITVTLQAAAAPATAQSMSIMLSLTVRSSLEHASVNRRSDTSLDGVSCLQVSLSLAYYDELYKMVHCLPSLLSFFRRCFYFFISVRSQLKIFLGVFTHFIYEGLIHDMRQ
jgi:hypothetical protein